MPEVEGIGFRVVRAAADVTSTGLSKGAEVRIAQFSPEQAVKLIDPPLNILINLGPLHNSYPVGLPEMLAKYVNGRAVGETPKIHLHPQLVQECIDIQSATQDTSETHLKTLFKFGSHTLSVAAIRSTVLAHRFAYPIEGCPLISKELCTLLPVPNEQGELVLLPLTQAVFTDLVRKVMGAPAVFPSAANLQQEGHQLASLVTRRKIFDAVTSSVFSGSGKEFLVKLDGNTMMPVEFCAATAQGRRDAHEDACLVEPVQITMGTNSSRKVTGVLLSTFDGMGGFKLGEVATANGVNATRKVVEGQRRSASGRQAVPETAIVSALHTQLTGDERSLDVILDLLQKNKIGGENLRNLLISLKVAEGANNTQRDLVLSAVAFMRDLLEKQNHDVWKIGEDTIEGTDKPGAVVAQALILAISGNQREVDVCVGHLGDATTAVLSESGEITLETKPHNLGTLHVSGGGALTQLRQQFAASVENYLGRKSEIKGDEEFFAYAPLVEYVRVVKGAVVLTYSDGALAAFSDLVGDSRQQLYTLFGSNSEAKKAILSQLQLPENMPTSELSKALIKLAIEKGTDNATLVVAQT